MGQTDGRLTATLHDPAPLHTLREASMKQGDIQRRLFYQLNQLQIKLESLSNTKAAAKPTACCTHPSHPGKNGKQTETERRVTV